MIRLLCAEEVSLFLRVLQTDPFLGSCLRTVFQCYGANHPLATFYLADSTGAIAVQGREALLAGFANPEELGFFLRQSGVERLKCRQGAAPAGYRKTLLELMRLEGSPAPKGEQPDCSHGLRLDEKPDLWRLAHSGLLEGIFPEDYYGDTARRRAKKLCDVMVLEEEGKPVSTAGVYSIQPDGAYLSAVFTREGYRQKGYARDLVETLARQYGAQGLWLLCRQRHCSYYEKIGFVSGGKAVECSLQTGENKG